jgi:hypothetical protein
MNGEVNGSRSWLLFKASLTAELNALMKVSTGSRRRSIAAAAGAG